MQNHPQPSNRGPEPGLTCSLVNVFKFSSFMKGTVSNRGPEPGLTCSLVNVLKFSSFIKGTGSREIEMGSEMERRWLV